MRKNTFYHIPKDLPLDRSMTPLRFRYAYHLASRREQVLSFILHVGKRTDSRFRS